MPIQEPIPVARKIAERRLGKFRVVTDFLREDWPKLLPLFSQVVVVNAKTDFVSDSIEYTALSNAFEIVEEGIEPPDYFIEVRQDGDKFATRFVKQCVA